MKYSYELLLKCDGLRFKAVIFNVPQEGIVKVEDGCVYLCYGAETYRPDRYNRRCIVKVAAESGLTEECIKHLEIVPRDPDTYIDFQVGDRLFAPSHPVMEVVFRSGEVVALKGLANGRVVGSGLRTCRELFEDGYCLIPTIIEKAIENDPLRVAARERNLNGEFNPSDGDLLWLRVGKVGKREGEWVIAFKELRDGNIHDHVAVEMNTNFILVNDSQLLASLKGVREWRYASEEEKQVLFDALAKQDKRWNAEKKVVEDIPDLRAVKSEIKSGHQFKKGEPVLMRDNGCIWKIGMFTKMRADYFKYGATTNGLDECGYHQCIPYNERTMHLLGTTEDYKEE